MLRDTTINTGPAADDDDDDDDDDVIACNRMKCGYVWS